MELLNNDLKNIFCSAFLEIVKIRAIRNVLFLELGEYLGEMTNVIARG